LWEDKTANGNDMIQDTATIQPELNVADMNGLDTIGGDGTDDILNASTTTGIPIGNDSKSIVMALRDSAVGGLNQTVFFLGEPDIDLKSWHGGSGFQTPPLRFFHTWGTDLFGNESTAAPQVWTGIKSGNNHTLRIDGSVDFGPTDAGTTTVTDTFFRLFGSPGGDHAVQDIGELFIVDSDISGGDLTNSEKYISDKWTGTI